MALFGKRRSPEATETYRPLLPPRHGSALMPDLAVLSRDAATINALLEVARRNVSGSLDGSRTGGMPLDYLDEHLSPVLLANLATPASSSSKGLLRSAIAAGLVVGLMENGGGVARPQMSEGHYWNVLVKLGLDLGRGARGEMSLLFEFALHSGYYVARSGESAIPVVIDAASVGYAP